MKCKLLAVAATAAVTVMTSCNNEVVSSNDQVEVKFASTQASVETRVNGNVWEINDPIGIYMVEKGTATVSAEGYANVKYKASASGSGTINLSNTGTKIFYPQNDGKVDFIAYHPHKTALNASNLKYEIDVTSQTSQTAIDLLYAKADNGSKGYDKNYSGAVRLPFAHQLVKLYLNVEKGAGVTDLTGLTVNIEGMNTQADFMLNAPAITNQKTIGNITPFEAAVPSASVDGQYEAILLPVSAFTATHKITFTIGTDVYTLPLSRLGSLPTAITSFAVGNKYTLNVTLDKFEVQITGEIADWQAGGSGDVAAD